MDRSQNLKITVHTSFYSLEIGLVGLLINPARCDGMEGGAIKVDVDKGEIYTGVVGIMSPNGSNSEKEEKERERP